jgi:hypothetical protein
MHGHMDIKKITIFLDIRVPAAEFLERKFRLYVAP